MPTNNTKKEYNISRMKCIVVKQFLNGLLICGVKEISRKQSNTPTPNGFYNVFGSIFVIKIMING